MRTLLKAVFVALIALPASATFNTMLSVGIHLNPQSVHRGTTKPDYGWAEVRSRILRRPPLAMCRIDDYGRSSLEIAPKIQPSEREMLTLERFSPDDVSYKDLLAVATASSDLNDVLIVQETTRRATAPRAAARPSHKDAPTSVQDFHPIQQASKAPGRRTADTALPDSALPYVSPFDEDGEDTGKKILNLLTGAEPSPVPLPTSLLLILSGLLGLGWMQRRRSQAC